MSRILLVTDYLDKIWWIETYVYDLKDILEKDWHKVKIFGENNISSFKKYFFLVFSCCNFYHSKKLKQKIQEFNPNIIWFHSVSRVLWPSVLKASLGSQAKKLITFHDLGYFSLFASEIFDEEDIPKKFSFFSFIKKSKKGKWLLPYSIFKFLKLKKIKNIVNKFDFQIVPSQFMRKYALYQKWWNEKSIQVLPNFIKKEKITTRKDIYQDKINFVFFWRLVKEKGFGLIIYFLANLWTLKFKDKEKFKQITAKVRFFIFWDWAKRKELIETFSWQDIYGNDIWFLEDLSDKSIDELDKYINKPGKIIFYFGNRNFEEIKTILSFSQFNLVPSLFLETFWLTAAEWAANKLVNIWFDKQNITNFILDKYKLPPTNYADNFTNKMFEIIENFNKNKHEIDATKNYELVKDLII